ncbi:DUF6443 domain-containing protein [Hymenobacter arcticus]
MTISTCGSDFDTYLHLVSIATSQTWDNDDSGGHPAVGCGGYTSYLSSLPKSDNATPRNTLANALPAVLPAGDYFIIAEGYSTSTGNLRLTLSVTPQFTPTITFTSSPQLQPGNVLEIIKGNSATLNVTGDVVGNFTWATSDGVPAGSGPSITVAPAYTTTYVVTGTGCNNSLVGTAQVTVQVALTNRNYITTNTILIPNKLTVTDISSMANFDAATGSVATANAVRQQQITYFDGLGRPMQQVQIQASTTKQDIVAPVAYDALGRTSTSYLPYTGSTNTGAGTNGIYQEDAIAQQSAFYQRDTRLGTSEPDRVANDVAPVAKTVYEASPLNRVLEQSAPGTAWQPGTNHTVKSQQRANTDADAVRQWNYDLVTKTYSSPGIYAVGQLLVKETLDEQNQLVTEYVDKQGKTVLKRVSLAATVCKLVYEGSGSLPLAAPGGVLTSIRRAVFGRLLSGSTCADAVFEPSQSANVTSYVQGLVNLPNAAISVPIDYQRLGPDPYSGSGKYLQVEATYAQAGAATDLLTYYVYDDLDNLRLVIQPEGYNELAASGSWTRTATDPFIRRWCFQYDYDGRHRVISKQTPGTLPVSLVYNQRNQVVLTQDGNQSQLATPEWSFTKYDGLGRSLMTGVVVIPGATQESLQTTLDNETVLTEAIDPSTSGVGYTLTQAYPRTMGTANTALSTYNLLSVTYYDNYKAPLLTNTKLACTLSADRWQASVRGLVTGTSVRIILPDGTSGDWLTTATYYDKEYRPVQTQAQNQLVPSAPSPGGITSQTMAYDFAGKLLNSSTQVTQFATALPGYTDTKRFTYDAGGRPEATYQVTGNQTEILLAKNSYNEIGQLIAKRLHSTDGTKFLQKVDYRYNIRGWLTNINDRDLTNGTAVEGQPADPDGAQADPDLFALELRYNNLLQAGALPQYNGNIAQAMWQTRSPNQGKTQNNLLRAYNYGYDPANRLLGAQYTTHTASGWDATNQPVDFSVSGIEYDGNGNLLKMTRMGTTNGRDDTPQKGKLDQLTYSYSKVVAGQTIISNQLLGVDDAATPYQSTHDFKDNGSTYNPSGNAEYVYDNNGSLLKDANKGITSISYTRLNQPSIITFASGNTIQYSYTATGTKLRKEVYTAGQLSKTTDYVGPAVFEFLTHQNSAPVFAQTGEGRVLYLATSNGSLPWKYEYHLKDHLGNLRFAFRADQDGGTVTQVKAGMEPVNATQEERQFTHVAETRLADPDHARTGDYVARLNARTGRRQGPSIRLKVAAGDSLRADVYARYDRESGAATLLQKGALVVGGTTISVPGQAGSDQTQPLATRRHWLPFVGASLAIVPQLLKVKQAELPTAYLRYELFNKDSQLVATRTQALRRTTSDEWQHLQAGTKADSAGFAHVSLVNESGTAAYFDDLALGTVAATPYQENHYDPFGLNLVGIEQADVPNSAFQYNGKEKQEDFGLNWTDYGARMYDAQLGRWNTLDRYAEKYYSLSPYHYAGNNPISFIDVNGDSLVFHSDGTGKDAALNAVDGLINDGLGGFYTAKRNERGSVTLASTGQKGKMSDSQKAFFNIINGIINQKEDVKVGVFLNDEDTFIGNFKNEEIDPSDMSKASGNEVVTPQSLLAHELQEQKAKQIDGNEYNSAHRKGINAENGVSGFIRQDTLLNSTIVELGGLYNGAASIPYSKGKTNYLLNFSVKDNNVEYMKSSKQSKK